MQIKLTKRPMFSSQKAMRANVAACLSMVACNGATPGDALEGFEMQLKSFRKAMSTFEVEMHEECIRQLQSFGNRWPS